VLLGAVLEGGRWVPVWSCLAEDVDYEMLVDIVASRATGLGLMATVRNFLANRRTRG
jgi:hypothetical protein